MRAIGLSLVATGLLAACAPIAAAPMAPAGEAAAAFTNPLLASRPDPWIAQRDGVRSEEHTSELQSLMRLSYAVFCLKKHISHDLNVHTPNTEPTAAKNNAKSGKQQRIH